MVDMNSDSLVYASVIIPAYRAESSIEKCIKSVQCQTMKNIEIIVVIDGDFDKSKYIVKKLATKDSRIKLIVKKNEGVSVARNVGIEVSQGKWIFFLDSDDWLEPDYIEKLTNASETSQADISICDYCIESVNGSEKDNFLTIGSKTFSPSEKEDLLVNCLIPYKYGNASSSTNIGVPWGKAYRREFIINNDLRFVPGLKRMQDAVFNLYCFLKANKIVYIKNCLYHYTKNTDASTTSYRPDFSITCNQLIKEFDKFFLISKIHKDDYLNIIDAKVISLFQEMIQLQFIPPDSNLKFRGKISAVRDVMNEKPYRRAIYNYKNSLISKKQRVFCVMLSKKIIAPIIIYYDLKLRKRKRILIKLSNDRV